LASAQEPPQRTVNYRIYSFFDVPIKEDVWEMRWEAYYKDYLLSSTCPVVYLWEPEEGWIYYYSSVRVNVTGRNLPEITIDNLVFLPYNLMGELEPGVTDGTAQLVDWYLNYPDTDRLDEIGYPSLYRDGWVSELTGKIILIRGRKENIRNNRNNHSQSLRKRNTNSHNNLRTNTRRLNNMLVFIILRPNSEIRLAWVFASNPNALSMALAAWKKE
jgi:hypothetical protein